MLAIWFSKLHLRSHTTQIINGVQEKCVTTRLPAANSASISRPTCSQKCAATQAVARAAAMQVDGFRPGLFGRLINLVTGRRR